MESTGTPLKNNKDIDDAVCFEVLGWELLPETEMRVWSGSGRKIKVGGVVREVGCILYGLFTPSTNINHALRSLTAFDRRLWDIKIVSDTIDPTVWSVSLIKWYYSTDNESPLDTRILADATSSGRGLAKTLSLAMVLAKRDEKRREKNA